MRRQTRGSGGALRFVTFSKFAPVRLASTKAARGIGLGPAVISDNVDAPELAEVITPLVPDAGEPENFLDGRDG